VLGALREVREGRVRALSWVEVKAQYDMTVAAPQGEGEGEGAREGSGGEGGPDGVGGVGKSSEVVREEEERLRALAVAVSGGSGNELDDNEDEGEGEDEAEVGGEKGDSSGRGCGPGRGVSSTMSSIRGGRETAQGDDEGDGAGYAPQRPLDVVELTEPVVKWLRGADARYKRMFENRVRRLADGERSYALSKALKGGSGAGPGGFSVYETKLDAGQRILWTKMQRGEVRHTDSGSESILVRTPNVAVFWLILCAALLILFTYPTSPCPLYVSSPCPLLRCICHLYSMFICMPAVVREQARRRESPRRSHRAIPPAPVVVVVVVICCHRVSDGRHPTSSH
jgi:hypothetical protein